MIWALGGMALAACSVLASPAIAEPKTRAEQYPNPAQVFRKSEQSRSVSHLFDELALTADQRAHCLTIVREGGELNRDLRGEARATWRTLMAALRRPDVSLQEAMATQRKLARLQATLAEKRLETWFAVRELLTTEQLDRLSSLKFDSTLWLEEDHGEPRSAKPRRNDVP
jgi:Spy/CpxP family protein refolding chaperone